MVDEHDEVEDKEIDPEVGDIAEIEIPEGADGEVDFPIGSPVAAFDDELGEDEDPHSSFDAPAVVGEDPHLDPYGVGAPAGFEDDEEEDEIEDDVFSDADSY